MFAAGRAFADATVPASDPIASIKNSISQAVAVFNDPQASLADRRERLRALCEQAFDFENMSRSVLGYHWRELTPAQRDEFVPVFTHFIQDAFLTKLQDETVQKVRAELKTVNRNYRNQFNRVINNQGYDQLVADLKAKETLFRQQLDQQQPHS